MEVRIGERTFFFFFVGGGGGLGKGWGRVVWLVSG